MNATEKRPVLVVTEADDITADMVITELNRRSVPVVRFNPADIGGNLTVSARFGTCPAPVAGQVRTLSRTTDLAQLRAVYWRRPVWPTFQQLGDNDARFAAAQVRYGLGGTLFALDGPLWVNHPLRNAAADYKPAQLALAQRLGLTVPPTLVTNDPVEARAFITAHGQVIYKTLRWTPYERDGVPVTGWAEPVTAAEIDDSVRVTPHLFQARVDKVADVRVLVVGRQVFAVRIDSGLLDWRKDYSALSYTVVDLPDHVDKALLAYLDHFGLVSGSFDLAVDRAGDYWWLELNPNGQWGWLEEHTGLKMSAAFADLLTRGDFP
ncbi:ATP-grasp ribosomal peptide maturase [Streptomyces fulvorobeus]|uniref:ATP-grasp ribosomal peptide maturase n=1 Tax=Streptomyces fulvorobeus TaxID=284028 RepID=A0A7J0C5A8_9ACTN|nr:ATP-grasp ribosomal peptide maturase [Streptomyces fulvorobeus]NYE41375.1 ATP-grasp ribosomal peptide maturase [Streptomyces fulvorobeus]GFM97725.1 ATP-grasp ribosomal peptide maturase [Streptomyces fulvorobeus]